MFTSRETIYFGQLCGHPMHTKCFREYTVNGRLACPMCEKPLVDIQATLLGGMPAVLVDEAGRALTGRAKALLLCGAVSVVLACAVAASRAFALDGAGQRTEF